MSLKKHVRGCVSLKKYKSQGKAAEVTVNSKEEKTLMTFVWISSKNSASGPAEIRNGGGGCISLGKSPCPTGAIQRVYIKYASGFNSASSSLSKILLDDYYKYNNKFHMLNYCGKREEKYKVHVKYSEPALAEIYSFWSVPLTVS